MHETEEILMHRHRMTTRLAVAIASTTLVAAGCGDDDDVANRDLDQYCDAALAIELLPEPDIDLETTSPEQSSATVRAFVKEEVRPLIDAVKPLVPDEIRNPAEVLISTLEQVEGTGDVSLLDAPAFGRASAEVHAFDLEKCGWAQTSLTAVDFGFGGSLPSAAGITSLDLTNEGDEFHLTVLGRKKDDVDASAADAFATIESEEQFDELFDSVTSISVPSGSSDYAIVALDPGEYVLFCPIPVGSVGDADGQGPPHFTQGMIETFTIN